MVEKFLQLISDTNPQIQESQWNLSRINTKKTAGVGLLDSHIQLFVASWTVAHQAPLSMEFSRQEYWRGLPFNPTVLSLANKDRYFSFPTVESRLFSWPTASQLYPIHPSFKYMNELFVFYVSMLCICNWFLLSSLYFFALFIFSVCKLTIISFLCSL